MSKKKEISLNELVKIEPITDNQTKLVKLVKNKKKSFKNRPHNFGININFRNFLAP